MKNAILPKNTRDDTFINMILLFEWRLFISTPTCRLLQYYPVVIDIPVLAKFEFQDLGRLVLWRWDL